MGKGFFALSDGYCCILFHFSITLCLVERVSSIRVFISAILRAFLTGFLLLLKRRVCVEQYRCAEVG